MRVIVKFVISIFIIITILITFYENILTSYAKFFTINNASKGADAILILAGNSLARVPKVIELYENNFSKTILVTSPIKHSFREKYKELYGLNDSEITLKILKQNSITPKIVESLKGGATSTFDEAYDLVNYIKRYNLKHIILVTDRFHSRRALYAFNKVFDLNNLNIRVEVASAKNEIYNETNWFKSEAGLSAYVSEGFKFIIYLLRSRNLEVIKES